MPWAVWGVTYEVLGVTRLFRHKLEENSPSFICQSHSVCNHDDLCIYNMFLLNSSSSEVWFDDVDPEDLEEITGKKTKSKTTIGDPHDMLVTGNLEGLVTLY